MNINVKIPEWGEEIKVVNNGNIKVPDNPIIPFIQGDGVGPDIWKATSKVLDKAVDKAYKGKKKIAWIEVYAGEKSWNMSGKLDSGWLPDETIKLLDKYVVSIKGPMTTPVGEGIRSINVALRQNLDLYVCLRPVRYFNGVPSLVKHPELVDMVIFRENTEDIYAGIEFSFDTAYATKLKTYLKDAGVLNKVRFPENSSFGIKPVSKDGTTRLVRAAFEYAIANNRDTVTLVHKGNIMKYTEGSFRNWGYELACEEFHAVRNEDGYSYSFKNPNTGSDIIVNDAIADAFLQNILLKPKNFSVIATLNLNGDYISDALAAQVGGIGIAPGANINFATGRAIFEATHGTAPKYADKDCINPCSLILSGAMMFNYLGWNHAEKLVVNSVERVIASKKVTFDFARNMQDATKLKCSEFGQELIRCIDII